MKRVAYLIVVALAVLGSAAQASPIFIFNTGVDVFGSVLADGTVGDPHYSLFAVPSGTTDIRVRTSAGGYPVGGGAWLGDDGLSAWIGPNNNSLVAGIGGVYDYRTTFDLTGLDPLSATLIGQWATDDLAVDILINGVSTGNSSAGYNLWTSFSINSGFVSGVNTIDFVVRNLGNDVTFDPLNPTGLRVEITGTAQEEGTIPEPASFVLLGAGLVGLSLLRRRPQA